MRVKQQMFNTFQFFLTDFNSDHMFFNTIKVKSTDLEFERRLSYFGTYENKKFYIYKYKIKILHLEI